MPFALVQSPDAFLKRKQRLVDLSPVYSRLLVHVHMISASFIARQIDKRYFPKQLLPVLQRNLQDSMRPRRVRVRRVHGGHSLLAAKRQVLDELLTAGDVGFLQADDVDIVLIVLPELELRALVEQVEQLAAVNLVEGKLGLEVFELRLG